MAEVVTLNYGKALTAKNRVPGPVPVYGSNGVTGFHSSPLGHGPTVILGRKGQGPLGVEWCEGPFWVIDTAYYASFEATLLPRFFYYFVDFMGLNHLKDGTSNPSLTRDVFRRQYIPLPPLAEQKHIAAVLGALDDKIENNRKMNETLEAMAQAIFRSWFVDFDPVIDNALRAGNDIPADLEEKAQRRREVMARDDYKKPPYSDLFPDHFVDSELGSIPGGWKVEKLEKVSDLSWGDTNTTKKSYVATGYPAYSAKGQDGFLPHFDYEKTGIVISAIGANCGTTWLAMGKWSCIKNTIRFWSTAPSTPTEYLFHATRGQNYWPRRGSAQPFVSQSDARNCKVITNSRESLRFGEIVKSFYQKISANKTESQTLAELRDTLLPKLISGEIRVPEIEGLVEETVS